MWAELLLKFKISELDKYIPIVPHTYRGRLFSTVRRMKAEKEIGIPINRRTGFAISTKNVKHASFMTEQEWEKFYSDLRSKLKIDFPEMYTDLFNLSDSLI